MDLFKMPLRARKPWERDTGCEHTLNCVLGTVVVILWIMLLGSVALMLSSCAADQARPPAFIYKTVEVKVPVLVRCVTFDQIPKLPAKTGSQMNGQAQHDLDIAAAAASQYRKIVEQSLILLGVCAG